jgi:hypothetical protein
MADTLRAAAAGLVATLAWMLVSSALIIANKRVYSSGFPYPMLVTGLGQLASAAGGLLLAKLGGRRSRGLPPLAWILPTIGPLWAATCLTMWLGNAAYLHLSVAFIQVGRVWVVWVWGLVWGLLMVEVGDGRRLNSPPTRSPQRRVFNPPTTTTTQIFKAMTPAVTLVLSAAAGQDRMSLTLVASVLLIAAGTG